MSGFWLFFKIFGLALLYIVIPLFTIFFGIIIASMYINHKMGRLHSWKDIKNRKIAEIVVWSDDFREACELFYENPDDERIRRVLKNVIMKSMTYISDGEINRHRCEITGIRSWVLKEQLKVNLNNEYYVKYWGDLPEKIES